jgi:serine/threonine-protein kinase
MPFDLAKLRPTGPEVAVLRDVGLTGNRAGAIAYSAGGMLARATGYVSGSYRERTRLVRADRGGKLEPLGEPDVFTGGPRVSPDGRQVALLRWDGTLWLHDLARGTRAKLPFDGGDPMSLAWSPDGSRLAFAVERESFDVCLQRSDGMGRAEVLKLPGLQGEKHPVSFTADGRGLLFRVQGASGGLWLAPLDGVGEPKLVVPLRARRAVVSPDGRWLAHVSSSSGRFQAYVQAFPGPGRGVQASLDGARALAWSADSRQLFFSSGDSLMAVRVEAGSEPHVSAPEKLLELAGLADFDVAPDRPGFLALQRLANEGRKTELELVLGFSSELERLAPTGR